MDIRTYIEGTLISFLSNEADTYINYSHLWISIYILTPEVVKQLMQIGQFTYLLLTRIID